MKSGTSGPWRPDDVGRTEREPRPDRSVHRAPRMGPRALERAEDRRRVMDRVRVLEFGLVFIAIALLLGFWQLQVVHSNEWTERAEANQHRTSRVRPARGLILDRNGEILATNQASYEVALLRESVTDEDVALEYLAATLDEPVDVLRERLQSQRGVPRFRPVVLASGISAETVVKIRARQREHPGVLVRIEPRRFYPMGTTAAHVLGHVGEVSPRQLTTWGDPYRMGDIVGQQGVESVYNSALNGLPGERYALVNSLGREVNVLREDPPRPGETVLLTIDAGLQRRAEELLAGRRGAVVALDVRTGGILTMASAPGFDPNLFATRFSRAEWDALSTDPTKPLQNRALQVVHAPGSIFKIVMAAAGLEEGLITANTTYFCPGGRTFYGNRFGCLGEHGDINVVDALAYSCNSFFYELGYRLGRDRIVKWAQRFGLGAVTGIDLPNEEGGIVPSDDWLRQVGRRYYAGETISLAIGQGPIAVSPLQQAHLAATAATGFVRQPHLLMGVERSALDAPLRNPVPPAVATPAAFSERTRQTLLRGLAGSIRYGSSRRAGLASTAVGGKTGTAQVASRSRVAEENEDRPEHLRNHAWFIAVAPLENPEVAIAVFVEHGGSGGGVAAPIGGELLAQHFGDEIAFRELPVATEAQTTEDTETP